MEGGRKQDWRCENIRIREKKTGTKRKESTRSCVSRRLPQMTHVAVNERPGEGMSFSSDRNRYSKSEQMRLEAET